MNRKQKIIVSVVGITIVLLALLGLTYAYYLTRIQGNTNTNSISITTANLELLYGDGNEIITASNIMPDTTIASKTFTVTNTGNTTIENYRVVLELASIEGVVPSVFVYPEDFEITLTCVSKNAETDAVSGTCSGYTGTWNNESMEMIKNTIASNIRHEYTLTIYYRDSGIDQSDDMGKNLNLKVQIYGETDTSTLNGTITGVDSTYAMKLNSNPKISVLTPTSNANEYSYSFIGVEPGTHTLTLLDKDGETVSSGTITISKGTNATIDGTTITVKDNQSNIYLTTSSSGTTLSSTATFNPYSDTSTLAYNIINNAMTNANGTIYSDNPITKPAEEITIKGTGKTGEIELDMSSQSNWYYGSTAEAAQPWNGGGSGDDPVSTCSDTIINKYISYPTLSDSWYVKSCKSETIAIVEGEIMEYESSLLTTQDDYGTSYYFRGNVEDNYVNFAGMCWRIVRIAGDGSTKLILEDQYTTCDDTETETTSAVYTGNWNIGTGNYGYELKDADGDSSNEYIMNYLTPVTSNTSSMVKAFYDFQTVKLADYTSKLKSGDWCLGDKAYTRSGSSGSYTYTLLKEYDYSSSMYYDSYTRLTGGNANGYQPILKCNGTLLDKFATVSGVSEEAPMYVSAITADEFVFAGGKYGEGNGNYYLLNNYQESSYSYFWSLSPYNFNGSNDLAFYTYSNGIWSDSPVNRSDFAFRPAISLASSAVITSGDGTISSPYIIG